MTIEKVAQVVLEDAEALDDVERMVQFLLPSDLGPERLLAHLLAHLSVGSYNYLHLIISICFLQNRTRFLSLLFRLELKLAVFQDKIAPAGNSVSMEQRSTLTDLPLDILVLITPYLDTKSFLALCSTCKAFYHPEVRLDPSYWRNATRWKFRVRNRPMVQNDGLHWQRLYKRMLTQSRVFTWGQNTRGCLGHPRPAQGRVVSLMPHASWPKEIDRPDYLGITADLQCGGWSTIILNDRGQIFIVGTMNGEILRRPVSNLSLNPLKYPHGFDSLQKHTAIRQFSAGRQHLLGLSDSGRIWQWIDETLAGVHVKFHNMDYFEGDEVESWPRERHDSLGRVRNVVAGWNRSSAYVTGTGIVTWDLPAHDHQEDIELDTVIVQDWLAVPRTNYVRPYGSAREPDNSAQKMGEDVGVVTNWILLECHTVFCTDIGKVFAIPHQWQLESGFIFDSIELCELQSLSKEDSTPGVIDIQGSFRKFGIFKRNGEVLIVNDDYLSAACQQATRVQSGAQLPPVVKIPALQNNGVIQLAFGDYHYHALHSNGSITSYGTEPQSSGALGLGGWVQDGFSRHLTSLSQEMMQGNLRGFHVERFNLDRSLLPYAYYRGRQVWFQPEKKKWLDYLASGGFDSEEAKERLKMCSWNLAVRGQLSEWIEQQGRAWDQKPENKQKDEDGLGAYFALGVTAAGWHSGALVLVNDDLVNAIADSVTVDDPEFTHTDLPTPNLPGPSGEEAAHRNIAERMLSLVNQGLHSVLGLPTAENNPYHETTLDPKSPEALIRPRQGKKYVWAETAFPRLMLPNNTEMPGEIPISEWIEKPPEWKLKFLGPDSTSEVFGVRGWRITGD